MYPFRAGGAGERLCAVLQRTRYRAARLGMHLAEGNERVA